MQLCQISQTWESTLAAECWAYSNKLHIGIALSMFTQKECTNYGIVKRSGIENSYSSCFRTRFWMPNSLFPYQTLVTYKYICIQCLKKFWPKKLNTWILFVCTCSLQTYKSNSTPSEREKDHIPFDPYLVVLLTFSECLVGESQCLRRKRRARWDSAVGGEQ